jgi:DNA-binding LytR/AlgR family response regulator
MPDKNGIDLAKELREVGYSGDIVFLSASREYGPESYEVGAFSYLLKPLTTDGVDRILNDLDEARKSSENASIILKTPGIAKSILLRNISFAEVIQHKVYFRLTDGEEIGVYMTIKEAAAILNDPRFIRCHRSYIINMEHIAEISEHEAAMRNGARIPIARSYCDTRKKYYRWVFGGAEGLQCASR